MTRPLSSPYLADAYRTLRFALPIFAVLLLVEALAHIPLGLDEFVVLPLIGSLTLASAGGYVWRHTPQGWVIQTFLLVAWAFIVMSILQHMLTGNASLQLSSYIYLTAVLIAVPILITPLFAMMVSFSLTLLLYTWASARLWPLAWNSPSVLLPVFISTASLIIYISRRRAISAGEARLQAEVRLAEQAAEIDRLKGLSDMAGGVAHHYNNLLQQLSGATELLAHELPELASNIGNRTDQIIQTTSQLAKLTNHLQTYTGNIFGDDQQIDLRHLIRDADLEAYTAPGTTLSLHLTDDIPTISGDAKLLREALRRIAENTVHARGRSGLELSISAALKDQSLLVVLKDNGKGMSPYQKNKAIDPFFTTQPAQMSGLGLSFVAGVMRFHKGTVDVQSTQDSGTIVTLAFPLPASLGDSVTPP